MARGRFLIAIAALAGLCACSAGSDPPLARVGKLSITRSEFDRKLAEVSVGYQNYVQTPGGRKQFLDVLIREKMMLAAALDSGAADSPAFKSEIKRLQEEQERFLREQGEYLMMRLWLDGLRERGILNASVDEAKDYHKRHPIEVGMRHILVSSPEQAESLGKRIKGGASFEALAKSHSLDYETAATGGKMAPAIYGEIIPDLEDVVFKMRTGDVGGPFKSKFGYHVLKKEYQKQLSFEQCQDRIIRLLEKEKLDRFLRSLQAKFPVEVVDEVLK